MMMRGVGGKKNTHTTIDASLLGHQHLTLVAVLALGNDPFAEQLRPGLFGLGWVKHLLCGGRVARRLCASVERLPCITLCGPLLVSLPRGSCLEVRLAGSLFSGLEALLGLLLSRCPSAILASGMSVLGLKKPFRLLCAKPEADFAEFSLLRATFPFFCGRLGAADDSACRFGKGDLFGDAEVVRFNIVLLDITVVAVARWR